MKLRLDFLTSSSPAERTQFQLPQQSQSHRTLAVIFSTRMVFNGIANQFVEFRILNYEFPNTLDREYDGNWLLINLNVQSSVGSWKTTDPSLLTWDVTALINWFKDLSESKKPEYLNQEFLEPNISFHLLSDYNAEEKLIKIQFDLESKPKFAEENTEYYVLIKVNSDELKRIAIELEKELEKFPERS